MVVIGKDLVSKFIFKDLRALKFLWVSPKKSRQNVEVFLANVYIFVRKMARNSNFLKTKRYIRGARYVTDFDG